MGGRASRRAAIDRPSPRSEKRFLGGMGKYSARGECSQDARLGRSLGLRLLALPYVFTRSSSSSASGPNRKIGRKTINAVHRFSDRCPGGCPAMCCPTKLAEK